jgi:hypothetical protein
VSPGNAAGYLSKAYSLLGTPGAASSRKSNESVLLQQARFGSVGSRPGSPALTSTTSASGMDQSRKVSVNHSSNRHYRGIISPLGSTDKGAVYNYEVDNRW